MSKNILRVIAFYENHYSTHNVFQLLDPVVCLDTCRTLSDVESLRELDQSVEKDINAHKKKKFNNESFALTAAEMLEMPFRGKSYRVVITTR